MSGARAEIASRFVDHFEGRDNINLMARIGWCFFHPVKWVRKAWHISYPSRSFRISGFTIKSLGTVRARAPCMKTLQKSFYLWQKINPLSPIWVDVKSHLSWWCRDFVEFYWFDFKGLWFGGLLVVSMLIGCTPSLTLRFGQLQRARFGDLPGEGETSAELFTEWVFCSTFWSFKMNGQRTPFLNLTSCHCVWSWKLFPSAATSWQILEWNVAHLSASHIKPAGASHGRNRAGFFRHSAKGCHFKHAWIIDYWLLDCIWICFFYSSFQTNLTFSTLHYFLKVILKKPIDSICSFTTFKIHTLYNFVIMSHNPRCFFPIIGM